MDAERCKSLTVEGQPCGAAVWRDGWCRWHHPANAEELAEARRKGGEASGNVNRKLRELAKLAPKDLADVEGLMRATLVAVLIGKVTPRQASAVAAVARALVAVQEAGEFESRLATLELERERRGA